MLMMLAFFIDQIQSLCCNVFNSAKKKLKLTRYLWERLRNVFQEFLINTWYDFFNYIINKPIIVLPADTS